jgi:putative membrane protein
MLVLALLHPFVQLSWLKWSIHPSTVIGIFALAALYIWRAKQVPAGEQAPGGSRKLSFFAGLFLMFACLNGPLHDLSDDYLFSAHMVQHLLLTLVMPPMLIYGVTGWMLRPLLANRILGPIARKITRPAWCFVIFNLSIAVWHIPYFYNAAMANHNIHIVEHLIFMVSAVLMWWPLTSPLPELPRLPYPGQLLYTFLLSLPMSVVAVYITLADHILYPAYSSAPRIFPLSPMDDQMLGGLIMWIPGTMIFTIILSVVFYKWSARGEDDSAGAQVDWKPKTA